MAENEKKSVGVKVTPTIPGDIYAKLEADAQLNGMKAATRIGQIVSLFYNGKLALVDVAGVQNVVVTTTAPVTNTADDKSNDEPTTDEPTKDKTEDKPVKEETNTEDIQKTNTGSSMSKFKK